MFIRLWQKDQFYTIIVFCWGQYELLWTFKTIFTEASRLTWHSVKFDIVWLKLVLTRFHFHFPLHYVWRHNEVINFILTWFHFHLFTHPIHLCLQQFTVGSVLLNFCELFCEPLSRSFWPGHCIIRPRSNYGLWRSPQQNNV
jgi:hypothetical protein